MSHTEAKEAEAEKVRDELLERIKPMRPTRGKQEWRPNLKSVINDNKADEDKLDIKVCFLPREFMCDYEDEEEAVELIIRTEEVVFKKPENSRLHLKTLFITGYINGKLISRMMVDSGATVILMPYSVCQKIERSTEDLVKTNMVLSDFNGNPTEMNGILVTEFTIGSKTLPTAFFVIEGKGNYNVLLGKDCIHVNLCIPSTLHQMPIQWVGDQVEVVKKENLIAETEHVDIYDNLEALSRKPLEDCDFLSFG